MNKKRYFSIAIMLLSATILSACGNGNMISNTNSSDKSNADILSNNVVIQDSKSDDTDNDINAPAPTFDHFDQDAAKIDTKLTVTTANASDSGITLKFNHFESEEDIHGLIKFSDDISIEKINDDDTLSGIPKLSEYSPSCNSYLYSGNSMHEINKTSTTEYNFNWESIYGKLESGNYRIIVRIWFSSNETRSAQDYYKYAYFTVSNN